MRAIRGPLTLTTHDLAKLQAVINGVPFGYAVQILQVIDDAARSQECAAGKSKTSSAAEAADSACRDQP